MWRRLLYSYVCWRAVYTYSDQLTWHFNQYSWLEWFSLRIVLSSKQTTQDQFSICTTLECLQLYNWGLQTIKLSEKFTIIATSLHLISTMHLSGQYTLLATQHTWQLKETWTDISFRFLCMKLQTCTLYVMEEKIYILAANIMYTIKLISCSCCKYCETEKMMLAQLFFCITNFIQPSTLNLKQPKVVKIRNKGKWRKCW